MEWVWKNERRRGSVECRMKLTELRLVAAKNPLIRQKTPMPSQETPSLRTTGKIKRGQRMIGVSVVTKGCLNKGDR